MEANLNSADVANAVSELMRDVDSLADWLGGHCYAQKPVAFEPQRRGITEHDLRGVSVPRLLAMVFDAGQPDKTRIAAVEAIQHQYMSDQCRIEWVMARANELAAQREEDERIAA